MLNKRVIPPPTEIVPNEKGPLPEQVTVHVPLDLVAEHPPTDMLVDFQPKLTSLPVETFGTPGGLINATELRWSFSDETAPFPARGSDVAAFAIVTLFPGGA